MAVEVVDELRFSYREKLAAVDSVVSSADEAILDATRRMQRRERLLDGALGWLAAPEPDSAHVHRLRGRITDSRASIVGERLVRKQCCHVDAVSGTRM